MNQTAEVTYADVIDADDPAVRCEWCRQPLMRFATVVVNRPGVYCDSICADNADTAATENAN